MFAYYNNITPWWSVVTFSWLGACFSQTRNITSDGVSYDAVLECLIPIPPSPDDLPLLRLTSCLFGGMTDNVANIAELQGQHAAPENRR